MRQMLRSRIAHISAERRTLASREIFAKVAALPEFVEARVVALYAALPDEPQSQEFITEWHDHKRIVLPRVEGDTMQFYDYRPDRMQSGAFGINEPQGCKPCPPEDIDVMIVPGVGFTAEGKRMGRGKGFYDRYLAQRGFHATTIGVCLKEQILPAIPTDPHDKAVDKVIFA